jgi:glycosyltransferase involved in cell wall biosynthesis
MRIGIDARELCGRATGAGRYLAGLLREWATVDRARRHDFLLYTSEAPGVRVDAQRFPTRVVAGRSGVWWEQVRLARAAAGDRLDVFFSPAYTTPLTVGVPTVVAIHDLSFVAHPEWFRRREGIRRRWLTRGAAGKARAVVTISEFSRRELIERLGVPAGRVHVIPPGVDRPPTAASHQPPATSPYRVLFVGSIFNRRHVPDLIRAFGDVARAHPAASLDIVGDNRSYPREDIQRTIDAEGLNDCARWHAYLADADLRELYTRARAFAFLSEYEGLGLTPLEALAAGVPPVLLDTPVARESCGDAALYVSVSDRHETARALERALFDEQMRTRILAAAPAALAKYQWPTAARDTLAVIEAAALAG